MIKKIISLILIVLMTASMVVSAGFTDVSSSSHYYEAIISLSEKGIINGFEDGTFKPNASVTRAQMAAMIVRAAELPLSYESSKYDDVQDDHWASGYIMAASKAGIINGMGNGIFNPEGNVTYNQAIKMAVCMIGKESSAASKGGWPDGYLTVAYSEGLIGGSLAYGIMYDSKGDQAADRQNVASIIYYALQAMNRNNVNVGGTSLSLGMSASSLGTPDEKIASNAGFYWYVYDTDTYKNFYAVGVDRDKVVAIASTGKGFTYKGFRGGNVAGNDGTIFADSNDGNKIHSVLLLDSSYSQKIANDASTEERFAGECKMNFHFTNAFRVMHGKSILTWSDTAAEAARLHSEDMATNNYFSHTSLDGRGPGERLNEQGVRWMGYAENIAAGTAHYLGFHAFDGWVNSDGHRKNMLSNNKYLGVGMAYSRNSMYGYYYTQAFFSGR